MHLDSGRRTGLGRPQTRQQLKTCSWKRTSTCWRASCMQHTQQLRTAAVHLHIHLCLAMAVLLTRRHLLDSHRHQHHSLLMMAHLCHKAAQLSLLQEVMLLHQSPCMRPQLTAWSMPQWRWGAEDGWHNTILSPSVKSSDRVAAYLQIFLSYLAWGPR